MNGSGTTDDPYLLPESTYLRYKDEFPNHAARIRQKEREGKLILVRGAAA